MQKQKVLFERHLIALIYGKYEKQDIQKIYQHINSTSYYRYISFEIDNKDLTFQQLILEEKINIQKQLHSRLQQLLHKYAHQVIYNMDSDEECFDVGLIYHNELAEQNNLNEKIYVESLCKQLQQDIAYKIYTYVGEKVDNLEKISQSYRSREGIKAFQDFLDYKAPIIYHEEINYKKGVQYGIEKQHVKELIEYVKQNELQNINTCIDKIYKELKEKLVEPQLIKMNIYFILYQLVDLAKELDKESDQEEILQYVRENLFEQIAVSGNSSEFKMFTIEFAAYLKELKNNSSQGIIAKIDKDIKEAYMENLSLRKLGEKYFSNSVYLGQLFKKEYGIPFKDYLNNVRIEKAIELLIHTNARVYAIAATVGYMNISVILSMQSDM